MPLPARVYKQVAALATGDTQVTRQVSQYGIKVSSWGSETFKIVIPVENQ